MLLVLLCCAAFLSACGAQSVVGPVQSLLLSAPGTAPAPLPEVEISELMAANKATLADENGAFPDWVELHNLSDQAIDLGGCLLTAGRDSWTIPALTLPADGYALIFCSKTGGGALCAGFALSADGETVTLRTADGQIIDRFDYTAATADESLVRDAAGDLVSCRLPTPGYANDDAGWESLQSARETPALSINEVTVYNRMYDQSDWVELRNNSDESIYLGDYYLSDSGKDRQKLALPGETLEPGGLTVVTLGSSFSLNSLRDQLYLSKSDGTLVDYTALFAIPYGGSYGRMPGQPGFFYFAESSLREENGGGARFIAAAPEAAEPDGVFNDVSGVTVTLSAPGTIYYTTDGSAPDESCTVYGGPITLSSSAVIRAINVEPGKLPSPSRDLSYIINENHSLPVTSLVVDPDSMWSGAHGIYANPLEDWEVPASLAFFDGDNSFHIGCGIKVHGATSRINMSKKSYKVNFRGVYGGDLEYDLFQNGVTEFSSILLRAAQESSFSTNMRDIVMHELAQQCDPSLPTQDYKYCILYINGEYWGIYALREAHSAEHFARHYGYDADQVVMWKEKWALKSEFDDVYLYMLNANMADDQVYDYVSSYIDLDSLITWCIIESYSGNIDINSPNVRFYYSYEDHKLHYALVDLDLGLFEHGLFTQSIVRGYDFSNVPLYLCRNAQFRALMMERLADYLHGPLSQENTFQVIDALAAELRPEIPRDAAMWGYSLSQWELELQHYLYDFMDNYGYGGYEREFVNSAKSILGISNEDYERLFGDL